VLALSGCLLVGCCLGLLPLTFAPGRLLLGGVGRSFLGGGITLVAFTALLVGTPWNLAVAPLVVHVVDGLSTLILRVLRGDGLERRRDHTFQRLIDAGQSPLLVATWVAIVVSLVCLTAPRVTSSPWWLVAWLGIAGGYVALGRLPLIVRAAT
jgi:UDP-N-acetylmuramyl pentapeptide phosphotransferase/UDP-N-acetylglucosamine-1-phosphate transferase